MKNRLSVFFFYDKDGIVRDFVTYFVKSLREISSYVLVVSNGKIREEDRSKLSSIADEIYERDNTGFDVWAYKDSFDFLTWDRIYDFEELVIANFTCYGPIFPFSEMFEKMESDSCDFWGAVKHPEQPNYLLPNNKGYINEHIMSYFMVIKESLLHDPSFKEYWDTVPYINSKTESTALHEVVFTKHFEELGFTSSAYVDLDNYKGRCNNSSIIKADELLIKDRCPLLKRRAFIFPNILNNLDLSISDHATGLIDYVKENSSYDTNMIWDDILSTTKLSILRDNIKPLSIIDDNRHISIKKYSKCNLIFILKDTSRTVISTVLSRLPSDEYNVVFSEFDSVFFNNICPNNNFVLQSNEVDFLTQILELKDELADYLVTSVFVVKNNCPNYLTITDEDFYRYSSDILFNKSEDVAHLCEQLNDSSSRLGLLMPQLVSFSCYWGIAFSQLYLSLYKKYKFLFEKMSLSVPFEDALLSNGIPAFTISTQKLISFSTTMSAVDIDTSIKSNYALISQILPLWIQNEGLFSSWLITSKYAINELSNLNYMREKLVTNFLRKQKKECINFRNYANSVSLFSQKPVKQNKPTNPILSFKTKYDLLRYEFSLKDSFKILRRSIRRLFQSSQAQELKKTKGKRFKKFACIYGMSIVEDEISILVHYCSSDKEKPYFSIGDIRQYPTSYLSDKEKMVVDHLNDYYHGASFYYVFKFSVHAFLEKGCMSLKDSLGNIVRLDFVNWTPVYNVIDFEKYSKVFYLNNGIAYCSSKFFAFKNELKHINSFSEKILFTMEFLNPFKYIWLFSENEGANDNSYELFKYAVKHTHRKCFYIGVNRDIVENKYKKYFVQKNSKKHFLLMNFASKLFSSFTYFEGIPTDYSKISRRHLMFARLKWYLVPHGMFVDKKTFILHKLMWGNPQALYAYNSVEKENWLKETEITNIKTFGFPRFSKWDVKELDNNEILIFFTWRQEFNFKQFTLNQFKNSDYYKDVISLIDLIMNKFPHRKIAFAFHHELVRHSFNMPIHNYVCSLMDRYDIEPVYYYNREGIDAFNYHFARAKYLITDVSSVAYDFASKKDAIVINYVNPSFIKGHHEYSPSNEVGYLAYSLDEVISCLEKDQNSNHILENRSKFFVPSNDTCKNILKEASRD